MKKSKFGFAGLTFILASFFAGCNLDNSITTPQPTQDPIRHWANITYRVEGKNGTPSASNITYGRIDGPNGNWIDGWYQTTGSVSVPWSHGPYNDCTGHWLRLGASTGASPAQLTLKIIDDGKVAAQKDITVLGNVEYYITTNHIKSSSETTENEYSVIIDSSSN